MSSKPVLKLCSSQCIILLTIIFFFLSINNAKSLDSLKVKTTVWEDISSDTKIFFNDGGAYYTSPLRFDGKDWLITLAGAGATFGIMELDEDIRKTASVHDGNSQTGFWAIARSYGEIKYWGTASVLTYTTGLLIRNKGIRITGRMLVQSLVYSGLLTTSVKIITGRTRPYNTNNQFQFNWFESNNDNQSFPSGHATVAFAVSTVFAESINTWWARVAFYSAAALAAYSRVHDTEHWMSDIVVGGLIGFSSGIFTVDREKERISKHKKISGKLNLYPSLNGFNLEYKF